MRFPKKFERYVGEGPAKQLGDDVDPTTLTPAEQQDYRALDNVLTARANNINGFPVQRIAVGCAFEGTGTPDPIPLSIFIFDDLSARWYKMHHETGPSITPGEMIFVDCVSLLDFPNTSQAGGMQSVGGTEVAIVPGELVDPPEGTYTFIIGADVSNPGI
jgi:hypothetical protein